MRFNQAAKLAKSNGWWHSFDFPGGERVEGVRGTEELQAHLARFPLPASLAGKRVLDIGAWDGWFSFEMERRGADVTAVDCWDNPRFRHAHGRFGSRVRYLLRDVYDLTPREIGHFDIVLFFGVLYHLKHPLLALEKVCAVARDMVLVESHVLDAGMRQVRAAKQALMEFYETDELAGQTDNWTAPNARCLLAMCRTAGFPRARLEAVSRHRAYVTCRRTWEPPGGSEAAPVLLKAIHNRDSGINFSASRDDYVSCWFRTPERGLRRETVRPAVAGWGAPPLSLEHAGNDVWQVNFKLPPGLEPGFHEAAVGTARAGFSNPLRIAVDVVPTAQALAITGICDGRSWEPGQVRLGPDGVLSLWVSGLPENADVNNTMVVLGERALAVEHVGQGQVNTRVPAGFPLGPGGVRVKVGDAASAPAGVLVVSDSNPTPARSRP